MSEDSKIIGDYNGPIVFGAKKNNVELKLLNKEIDPPQYATPGSAGVDLKACIDTPELIIAPGETILIPTGIAMHINDDSVMAMLAPRSGLGHKHGIVLGNLVGIIDSDYDKQVFVSCWNRGYKSYIIQQYERIAQMVFVPVIKPEFQVVEEFSDTTEREGGFGSTGK